MEFLYVFVLMFLSIFGLTVLVQILARALLDGSSRKFEIYVRENEDIEELLANLRKNPNIGRVCVVVNGSCGDLSELSRKYDDVEIVGGLNDNGREQRADT